MIQKINTQYNITLGSGSPRRMQLLKDLGLHFRVMPLTFDESYPSELQVQNIAAYLAEKKADAYTQLKSQELLLTADTIVAYDEKILGKPTDKKHAVQMLNELSGKTHNVITGVCIKTNARKELFSTQTKVTFDLLQPSEINHYVDTYKPYDKAGAYGIQEWFGLIAVKNIEGSYFNVMGLPVQQLYKKLLTFIEL